MLNNVWSLQLFADEGDTGASVTETNDAVVSTGDDAQTMGEEKVDATPKEQVNPETTVSFDDLIKGEYKKDFKKATSNIVKKRVSKVQSQLDEANARYDSLRPMLDTLGEKYRVDPNDIESLNNAILNDKTLYEEEAMERGMDVDTLMQIKGMEQENRLLEEQMRAQEEEKQRQMEFAKISQQADELKAIYPEFDLEDELQNETFAKMLHLGFSVKNAFESTHIDELNAIQAEAIASKATEKVANSVKANAKRPSENGLKSQPGAKVNNDIKSLTKEELDEYIARANKGESISFS